MSQGRIHRICARASDQLCVKATSFSFLFLPDVCTVCPDSFSPCLISFSPTAFISFTFYSTLSRFMCEARQHHQGIAGSPLSSGSQAGEISVCWETGGMERVGRERRRESERKRERDLAEGRPVPSLSQPNTFPLQLTWDNFTGLNLSFPIGSGPA